MASMGGRLVFTTALAGVNVLLLTALTAVWVRNYRTFRSSMVAGLAAFGAIMLLENAAAIYFFFSTSMLYSSDPGVQQAVTLLRVLQVAAISFLGYATLK